MVLKLNKFYSCLNFSILLINFLKEESDYGLNSDENEESNSDIEEEHSSSY